MSKRKDKKAAQAASLPPCHSHENGNPLSLCALTVALRSASPSPLLMHCTTQSQIYATFGPGASGCVRVYPDSFLLYLSKTYLPCPGRPGKIQHIARMRARACVFFFFLSDTFFYLNIKAPGQPGQLFQINNLHPDSHPDAPGQPGQAIYGGLSCH
jgi:hypothetical protein